MSGNEGTGSGQSFDEVLREEQERRDNRIYIQNHYFEGDCEVPFIEEPYVVIVDSCRFKSDLTIPLEMWKEQRVLVDSCYFDDGANIVPYTTDRER